MVGARHLKVDALVLVQPFEVESLNEHIRKLGIGYARFHLTAHKILVKHIVDVYIFAVIAEKVDNVNVLDPVIIVDHFKGKEFLNLSL